MSFSKKIIGGATGAVLLAAAIGTSLPAQAGDSGAFIGGMLTSRVMSNMHQRTEAEQQQAYYAQQNSQQQQVQQAAPAPAAKTTQQKLDELDKLAAGGYITPAEYKTKKQQIINSM
ncbi:MAG: SHOCT domain-containing protein [Halieaceae bacterium]